MFDDHDVHDDWNISWLWIEVRRTEWWEARVTGAFMAYWIDHTWAISRRPCSPPTRPCSGRDEEDAGRVAAVAREWDRESAAVRWASYRDFGDTRLLVLDSRAARVLSDGRRR